MMETAPADREQGAAAREIDLSPYAGRWVALAAGQVAGVGETPEAAEQLGRRNRLKEHLALYYVEPEDGERLPLSPLIDRLRPILAGQEMPVYLVGGAVRDALLARATHDLDLVAPRKAISLAFKAADILGLPAYVLDQERDAGRIVLPDKETTIDFVSFRGPDLEDDLRKRDFTINAIALPASASLRSSLIDPCRGLSDLAARRIRLTHPESLARDPVRVLRAVRLAIDLSFELVPETRRAVQVEAANLPQVSAERVRDELLKIVSSKRPHEALRLMQDLGVLPVVLPEIAALEDVAQSLPHHEAVLAHTFSTLRWLVAVEGALFDADRPIDEPTLIEIRTALVSFRDPLLAYLERSVDGGLSGRTLLRLGALFHDVGKATTQRVEEDGRIRFFGHDRQGALLAASRLRAIRLSNEAVHHVRNIVAYHMRPLLLSREPLLSRRAVFRFFKSSGTAGLDICLLGLADHLATHAGPGEVSSWQRMLATVVRLYSDYFVRSEERVHPLPLVNGRDLMRWLDLEPGPEVGRLLRLIEEAQAGGEINTPEEALNLAKQAQT